jgi:hypothetical protein
MRHQFTPIFKEFTTCSMWAEKPPTRCVWIWLMLNADPEGFVPGTIPGLAVAANVSLDECREAVGKFMAPDPDSNTQAHEGRRLEKVPHGWRILNFEYWRELARHEAEKARKRRWINQKRSKQLQLPFPPEFLPSDDDPEHFVGDVDATSTPVDGSEKLDAPKPISKPLLSSSSSTGEPLVLHSWPEGLELSDEFIVKAKTAGVLDPQKWFDKLKQGPIGGQRGVLAHKLADYLDSQIGKWRTFEETDRAKDAQRSAATAPSSRFAPRPLPADPFQPDARHEAYAQKHGLDLGALLKGVLDDYPQPLLPPQSRLGVLGERLTVAAKQKRAGMPVTGKLTREQTATWGPVPPGGAIPEVA